MSFHRGRGRGRGRGMFVRSSGPEDQSPIVLAMLESRSTETKEYSKCDMLQITLELDLDPATEAWFTQFKNAWNLLKRSPSVVTMLHHQYEACINPYEQALRLMYNCLDFKYAKPKSLPFMIMEEFKVWSDTHKNRIHHLLTRDVKISAFKVVKQQSLLALKKLVSDIYEMVKDCDVFLDVIKYMIQEKQYKEACQSAALLGLHSKFTIDEFLIPLILQDKLTCVDEFLARSPQHQTELVAFLDSLLGQTVSIKAALEPLVVKSGIPEIKWAKMHYKPWRKLVNRLVKLYNLPPEASPCLNKKRNEGALQFLLHKRFVENSFGNESWKEMIQEAVKDDERLQEELVVQVSLYGDVAEALHWAQFYSIPPENWPSSVRHLNNDPERTRPLPVEVYNQIEPEEWCSEDKPTPPLAYHKFELDATSIKLVDTQESFELFLDQGLRDVNIVGIDCEWKPTFGLHKNELALMQIATRSSVFILDVVQLGSKVASLWQELGKFLFNNCDILKLGFSFSNDFSMIRESIPSLVFNQKQIGYMDLLQLWKQIEKHPQVVFPHEVQSKGPSLSTLVHQCLGHPLDKSDQFSNWEKRPLRESQLVYAALDAYCLIQVYDVLKSCCDAVRFPFEETCYSLMSSTKAPKRKPKKKVVKKMSEEEEEFLHTSQPSSPHVQTVPANSIKVVCDTMLQGLGKSLRRCGIDTAILENETNHMECVRLYQNENRYILTKGHVFRKLMGNVPEGFCLKIVSNQVSDQLKQVLDYYKITVTKDDVFSRCQKCNSNSFVRISPSTMNALAVADKEIDYIPPPADYSDFNQEDEATGFSSEEDCVADECQVPVSYTRKWDIYADEKIDMGLCMTRFGAKILVSHVPYGMLRKVELFYVCEHCGKVYWDGSHFNRVLTGRLQGIVH